MTLEKNNEFNHTNHELKNEYNSYSQNIALWKQNLHAFTSLLTVSLQELTVLLSTHEAQNKKTIGINITYLKDMRTEK